MAVPYASERRDARLGGEAGTLVCGSVRVTGFERGVENRCFDALPFKPFLAAIVQSRAILTKRVSSWHEFRASKNVWESATSQAAAVVKRSISWSLEIRMNSSD
jgi:hypothetical protein